jgi:DNA-binding winged helix-turn-helix (wHTH) protein
VTRRDAAPDMKEDRPGSSTHDDGGVEDLLRRLQSNIAAAVRGSTVIAQASDALDAGDLPIEFRQLAVHLNEAATKLHTTLADIEDLVVHLGAAASAALANADVHAEGVNGSRVGTEATAMPLRSPTSGTISAGGITLDLDGLDVTVDGRRVRTALADFQLLRVLVANAGRVISRSDLQRLAWGRDETRPNTMSAHVLRVRRLIERDPHRPSRLVVIRGVGYKLDVDITT